MFVKTMKNNEKFVKTILKLFGQNLAREYQVYEYIGRHKIFDNLKKLLLIFNSR